MKMTYRCARGSQAVSSQERCNRFNKERGMDMAARI
jgi:hypothetical protein